MILKELFQHSDQNLLTFPFYPKIDAFHVTVPPSEKASLYMMCDVILCPSQHCPSHLGPLWGLKQGWLVNAVLPVDAIKSFWRKVHVLTQDIVKEGNPGETPLHVLLQMWSKSKKTATPSQ